MKKLHLGLTLAVIAVGGVMTLARVDAPDKGRPTVKRLSEREIAEKIDGKKTTATTVEVMFEPGQASAPHRHPGPVFGYVLEGSYEWAIDDQAAKMLQAGDTFYEPANCVHRVSRNPSVKTKTRVLAIVLHPQDVKEIVIPEKPTKPE
jgi:quercetin dioxygenase-like cupin family protein